MSSDNKEGEKGLPHQKRGSCGTGLFMGRGHRDAPNRGSMNWYGGEDEWCVPVALGKDILGTVWAGIWEDEREKV